MPPLSKEQRPAMRRALPADMVPGVEHKDPATQHAQARFGDGSWRPVTVLSWQRDRHGRWVCHLEWTALTDTWTEHYVYDPDAMRPLPLAT